MTTGIDFELSEDQRVLQASVREMCERLIIPNARRWDEEERFPHEIVPALGERGLLGMQIPEAYGGAGMKFHDYVIALEEVAHADASVGLTMASHNSLCTGHIYLAATEAQKQKYLPRVVRGDKPAIAITEPGAGSAASELETRAERDGDAWVLTGTKRWITGAGVSRTYVVLCRFDGIPGSAGIGALIVEADTPGLAVTRRERAMGMRGIPEGEVVFDRCRVPSDNLLLPAGGFKRLMSAYNGQRVGAATVALGIAQGALEAAVRYAGERQQFGRPIGHFQGLRWMVADMALQVEAARQLIYRAAANAGHGLPDMIEAAMAKTLASETAVRVTNDALQIFGASGYSRDLPLERMVRDARMFTIGGGTVQMMRNLVAGAWLGRPDDPGL
jgi:3-sulfinopropanoyl-CoA desulfinase